MSGHSSVSDAAPCFRMYHDDSLAIEGYAGNQWFLAYSSVILNDDEIRKPTLSLNMLRARRYWPSCLPLVRFHE